MKTVYTLATAVKRITQLEQQRNDDADTISQLKAQLKDAASTLQVALAEHRQHLAQLKAQDGLSMKYTDTQARAEQLQAQLAESQALAQQYLGQHQVSLAHVSLVVAQLGDLKKQLRQCRHDHAHTAGALRDAHEKHAQLRTTCQRQHQDQRQLQQQLWQSKHDCDSMAEALRNSQAQLHDTQAQLIDTQQQLVNMRDSAHTLHTRLMETQQESHQWQQKTHAAVTAIEHLAAADDAMHQVSIELAKHCGVLADALKLAQPLLVAMNRPIARQGDDYHLIYSSAQRTALLHAIGVVQDALAADNGQAFTPPPHSENHHG